MQAEAAQTKAQELQTELGEAYKSKAQISEDLLKVGLVLQAWMLAIFNCGIMCTVQSRMVSQCAASPLAGQCAAGGGAGEPRAHRARSENLF